MFKRFKSLTIVFTILVVLVGGSKFVSDAAANEEGSRSEYHQITYDVSTDEMFEKFYKQLLEEWNSSYGKTDKGHLDEHGDQVTNREHEYVEEEKNKETNSLIEEQPKVEEREQVEPKEDKEDISQDGLNAFEREVFELTNVERVNNGLEPLQIDNELSRVAREKSRDMAVNFYFDHNSPVYGSPFDMMRFYGISYRAAGENIAKGQRTAEEVVQAWMNSPGHRANILNSSFTHIGVGFVEDGHHWTQQFIGK